jgi:hypothetical protein
MSIPVREIATAVLFNLEEMYSRKHSDPELIEAINAILRYVNMALINRESNWVVKEANVKPRNGKAKLPDDFAKMKGYYTTTDNETADYTGDYKILKDIIYVDSDGSMDYYYTIPMVTTMDDEIDLPYLFLELFVRFVTGLIDGTMGKKGIDQLVSTEVDNLAKSANYPVIERPMQFYC